MSSHEAEGSAAPTKALDDAGKKLQEVVVIAASDKETVSPGRLPNDVVETTGDEDAVRASHATNMPGAP